MSVHPAVRPSVGPFVRWPARLRRRSSSPPLRSDTPASHRCGRMHRPSHRIPSAVSAAPRRVDAPCTPAPRPPHCVSSAASAALPPVRRVRRVCRVRRAPLHRHSVHSRAPSAALCLFRCIRRIASRPLCLPCPPRPVRRIVSLPLHPPHCLPSAVSAAPRCIDAPFIPAPRLPPANPARMRRAAGSGASAGMFGLFGLPASSPALQPPQPHAPPMSSPPCPRPTAAAARPESKISIKAYSGTAKNSYFWWQKNARSALRCVRTERFRQAGRRSAFARAIPEDGNDREKQQRKT